MDPHASRSNLIIMSLFAHYRLPLTHTAHMLRSSDTEYSPTFNLPRKQWRQTEGERLKTKKKRRGSKLLIER